MQVALVHTNNLKRKFFGAGVTPIIYKPRIYTNDQVSSTRIKLSNGEDSFEAGWMVNPNVFHDNESHLYASFSAQGKGCINLQCPGFVQVATDVALGMVPSAYSVIGGQQLGWNLSIVKSEEDEYWWLFIGAEKKAIGYWPKELFIPLALVASKVEWGGEIYDFGSNSSSTPLPDMGNGLKARDEPPYYSGANYMLRMLM
uniref:Neprosin PEP catalytic domain-containing protein n=1 Tax=Chenopodium quinoa TaxID=63459 RepID=A0A803MVW0_CHEQI